MTLTLTPEIENALAEQARREGTTAERLALDGLQSLFVSPKRTPDEILGLAAQAYEGLSQKEREEVERIALDRSQPGVLLKEYGLNPAQAAELRGSLASFADEWNQPGMDVYDDYEAAKARLHAR